MTERDQATIFCRDFFGTSKLIIDDVSFVDALAGYLARIKADLLRGIQAGDTLVGEQLELFQQQGVLF